MEETLKESSLPMPRREMPIPRDREHLISMLNCYWVMAITASSADEQMECMAEHNYMRRKYIQLLEEKSNA